MDKPNFEPKIIGWGHYTPQKIVSNYDLEKTVDTNDNWIFQNLGIKERRVVTNEKTSDLAYEAGLRAIKKSKLNTGQIDLIIVATATPDRLAPSTAAIVQGKLGLTNAACFDINAVCSGGVYSMAISFSLVKSGLFKNILVIGADVFSRITDWSRRDSVFFGDGAGAMIITRQYNKHLLASNLHGDGTGWEAFTIPGGGSENPISQESLKNNLRYFKMDGRAVFAAATNVLPKTIAESLFKSNLEPNDIDYVVPHQPSINILKKTSELTGISWDKWLTNMDKYANTSSATIMIIFSESCDSGKFKTNQKLLFAAVGSGWTYGSIIYKW